MKTEGVIVVEPDISVIANLIGDSARARMLTALMGGKALTATELALEAEITSQTASSHLAKLTNGQLLIVRKQGRHKYFQLQGIEIAELLESLLNMASNPIQSKAVTGPDNLRLRKARICYDHLAGELGVALYDSLKKNEFIIDNMDETLLTSAGKSHFSELGVNFNNKSKRPLCKSCLDWSERRNHLAGVLGQWILDDLFTKGWAVKDLDSRAIQFTAKGLRLFTKQYAISVGST